jgi:hypothetical protein
MRRRLSGTLMQYETLDLAARCFWQFCHEFDFARQSIAHVMVDRSGEPRHAFTVASDHPGNS